MSKKKTNQNKQQQVEATTQTFNIGQEVQFLGATYKIVEVLSATSDLHIKKVEAPHNSMVVPESKLKTPEEVKFIPDEELPDELDFSVKPVFIEKG